MKNYKSSLKTVFFIVAVAFLFTGCAETEFVSHWAKKIIWPGQKESKGTYKIGDPYKVGNVWYYPEENFNLEETGIASWYGPGFHAKLTANGELFDKNELTAAHRTLQLPSLVRVTNLENGRSIVVRVNDRGPFAHGRILDLSMRAADLLGFANKGTARVRIKVLEKESRILAAAASRGEDTTRMTVADINKYAYKPIKKKKYKRLSRSNRSSIQRQKRISDDVASADIKFIGNKRKLPESFLTPTITVDSLKIDEMDMQPFDPLKNKIVKKKPLFKKPIKNKVKPMAAGSIKKGHFMPAKIVLKEPIMPTGLFVQAGAFGVYSNAEKLAKKMVNIASTVIDPVVIRGHKLYLVKLGPIASLKEADSILERVIKAGQGTAWLIKKKK